MRAVTNPAHLWSGIYAPKGQTSLLWDALVSSPNYAKETSLINIQIIEPCTWNVTAPADRAAADDVHGRMDIDGPLAHLGWRSKCL